MAKASDNVFPKLLVSSGSAPATPSAGQGKIYEKSSDKKLYFKNEDGTEYDLTATGGGGGAGGILAYTSYNPGSLSSYSTTSTTFGDVDATNLKVTFTAPASGAVDIRLIALAGAPTGSGQVVWGLRESTTTIKRQQIMDVSVNHVQVAEFVVIGLTSGNSYTYKWGWCVTGGSTTANMYAGVLGSNDIPAQMKVYALP